MNLNLDASRPRSPRRKFRSKVCQRIEGGKGTDEALDALAKASAAAMLSKQTGEASVRSAEARQRLAWTVWEQIPRD